MVYNKKIEGVLLSTYANGNTYYRNQGNGNISEQTFAETIVNYKDEKLLELFVSNQLNFRRENDPKKQITIHKSVLEKLGFEIVID